METPEIINGYEIINPWKESSAGQTATGKKRGKKYFIKKYTDIRNPVKGPDISDEIYEKRLNTFNELVALRSDINKALRKVSGPGGNIVAPVEEFVYDNHYYEVTDYIDGVFENPDEVAALPYEDRVLLLKTAAAALSTVHNVCKIIHCDIKSGNLMAARNREGYVIGKLIDFDNSIFTDRPLPKELGGDQNYMSPELMAYMSSEGDPEIGKKLSVKTDIFSLGIVFHYYLAGKLPEYADVTAPRLAERIAKGKRVCPCQVVASGGRLVISDKIADPLFRDLVEAMTRNEPEDRPTAQEVLAQLRGGHKVSTDSGKKEPPEHVTLIDPSFDDPWPEDKIEWNKTKILFLNGGIRRGAVPGSYVMLDKLGKPVPREYTRDSLISRKYAFAVKEPVAIADPCFDDPWEEDRIVWNKEKILRFNSGIKRGAAPGSYVLLSPIGKPVKEEFDREKLLSRKYAFPAEE